MTKLAKRLEANAALNSNHVECGFAKVFAAREAGLSAAVWGDESTLRQECAKRNLPLAEALKAFHEQA